MLTTRFPPIVCGLKRSHLSYFKVYLAEITADTQTCSKRNVHGRSHKDILKVCDLDILTIWSMFMKPLIFCMNPNGPLFTQMSNNWEPSPRHMVRLDVRSLLQDAAIEEVCIQNIVMSQSFVRKPNSTNVSVLRSKWKTSILTMSSRRSKKRKRRAIW